MNKEQLEKICDKIDEMRKILDEDTQGSYGIKRLLDELEETTKRELKDVIWKLYLAKRSGSG
jgi:hypothetical protein